MFATLLLALEVSLVKVMFATLLLALEVSFHAITPKRVNKFLIKIISFCVII